jgi:hypothetical protein
VWNHILRATRRLRTRGYSAGHGESDNFFARGSSGGRRRRPLLARLQSVHVKTALTLSRRVYEMRHSKFNALDSSGLTPAVRRTPKQIHVLNSPASEGNAAIGKKRPTKFA